MMLGGDELSHTQGGNNNAYCQDNEITWLDWELDDDQKEFLEFVKKVSRIWQTQPVLQRRKFFKGRPIRGAGVKDITWLDAAGGEMTDEAWNAGFVRCLGMRLAGDLIGDVDERGEPIIGETLVILLNAHWEPIPFTLPEHQPNRHWELLLDTAEPDAEASFHEGKSRYDLKDRSMVVLRLRDRVEEAGKALSAGQTDQVLDVQRARAR